VPVVHLGPVRLFAAPASTRPQLAPGATLAAATCPTSCSITIRPRVMLTAGGRHVTLAAPTQRLATTAERPARIRLTLPASIARRAATARAPLTVELTITARAGDGPAHHDKVRLQIALAESGRAPGN
jgi:hypothetical protein